MAKKKVELTPEEKLAQALVPKEEQPYEIPEGWKWVRLSGVYQINPKIDAPKEIDAAFIPMEKISAGMVSEFSFDVQTWEKAKKGHTQFADNDVAFAKISPCFENRKSMILQGLPNGIGGGTTELIILRSEFVIPKFTFWLVSDENFIRGGKQTYSGTVGQQRISMDFVKNYPVPLPPLADQQRIVERIESLFSKLDEAKEKTQAVVDGFELRKSAILHKAFSGELTAKWREEHGVGLESWEKKALKDILDVRDGTHDSPLYYDEGYALVTSKNLKNGTITDDGIKYISREDFIKINERSKVDIGDILFAMIGTIGNPVVVENEPNYAIKNVALLKNVGKVNPYYVKYYLESQYVKDKMKKEAKGSTQRFVPLGYLRKFEIVVTINDEQKEIVRILGSLLAKEARAKEAAEAVLEQVEVMKKAVLARAFRGELC
ncbi:restriction endonuclease subunit S [Phascolarctobacterium sp.]|uniref:restriction endonuclease subunit S n=1 Tax=Phascolarctobacterium sp. TaxID=2049039 RepID=UPI0038651D7E